MAFQSKYSNCISDLDVVQKLRISDSKSSSPPFLLCVRSLQIVSVFKVVEQTNGLSPPHSVPDIKLQERIYDHVY